MCGLKEEKIAINILHVIITFDNELNRNFLFNSMIVDYFDINIEYIASDSSHNIHAEIIQHFYLVVVFVVRHASERTN